MSAIGNIAWELDPMRQAEFLSCLTLSMSGYVIPI